MRVAHLSLGLGVLLACGIALGQTVTFDVVPLTASGQPITTGPVPIVLIAPGGTVPFQISATVSNTLANGGLVGFNINVLTNLGITQSSAITFNSTISPLFTVGQSAGTPSGSNIVNISGQQSISTGPIVTTIALNQSQIIGTGQLVTPTFQGSFSVNVTGTASVFGTNLTLGAATVNTGPGFILQTSNLAGSQPGVPFPGAAGTGSPGSPSPNPVTTNPPEEVSADSPSPPPLPTLTAGLCGFGVELAMGCCLLGLLVSKLLTAERRT